MFTTDPLLPEVYKTNLISTIVDEYDTKIEVFLSIRLI